MNSCINYEVIPTHAVFSALLPFHQENLALFNADPASHSWRSYLEYVDEMVVEGLFSYISHSLQFFADNMESWPNQAPLFETRLVLSSSSGMIFQPSLERDAGDGLYELVEGLLADIFKTSVHVKRVAADLDTESYQVLMQILKSILLSCKRFF